MSAQFGDESQAVLLAEIIIDQRGVDPLRRHPSRCPVSDGPNRMARTPQQRLHAPAHGRIVIDDEQRQARRRR